ncbi:MAG: hypothetical protein QOF33_1432 [Thermomicrobiales bacterium]|jgi:predicted nucleic acid-binding protein|nr:hypothetical protein [Thermomicrobiales bacterium]
MPAVSNGSPLNLYAAIGRLDILRDVFTQVAVPSAVWEEVVIKGTGRGSRAIRCWYQLIASASSMREAIMRANVRVSAGSSFAGS